MLGIISITVYTTHSTFFAANYLHTNTQKCCSNEDSGKFFEKQDANISSLSHNKQLVNLAKMFLT